MHSQSGPRVSAIIPSYNRADLISETISSLLAQTAPLHEIIVVDDGSIDDTEAAVAAFGSRVRYLRIENSGAPVARNIGAAAATGDWLWFCDSDDLWRPNYVEQCLAIAATPPHPRFVFGNFRLVTNGEWGGPAKFNTAPTGFWSGIRQTLAPGGAIFLEPLYGHILTFQPIFHSTILMERGLFYEVGGYDPAFARTGSEDFEFTLRCMRHAPVGAVATPLVGIRRHEGNFSGNHLRTLLGEVSILRHARQRHGPLAEAHAGRIEAEITRRSLQALDEAFALDDYTAVGQIGRELDLSTLDARCSLKLFLASLPATVRNPIVSAARLKNLRKTVTR